MNTFKSSLEQKSAITDLRGIVRKLNRKEMKFSLASAHNNLFVDVLNNNLRVLTVGGSIRRSLTTRWS